MNDQTGKLLVVESDDTLRATLVAVLGDAGYKVSTDYREGMKAVLTFEPDLVILGADHRSWIVATFFLKSKVPSTRAIYELGC